MGKRFEEYAGYNGINPRDVKEVVLTYLDGDLYERNLPSAELLAEVGIELDQTTESIANQIRAVLAARKPTGAAGEDGAVDCWLENLLDFIEE